MRNLHRHEKTDHKSFCSKSCLLCYPFKEVKNKPPNSEELIKKITSLEEELKNSSLVYYNLLEEFQKSEKNNEEQIVSPIKN